MGEDMVLIESIRRADRTQIAKQLRRTAISAGVLLVSPLVWAKSDPVQLSKDITPSLYSIDLTPHADSMTFEGNESIEINIQKPTSEIVLNALDITVQSAQLIAANPTMKPITLSTKADPQAQTISFTSVSPIDAGKYQLKITYKGIIGTQAVGLFALNYVGGGVPKRALFTQFENSDARRMFPSFDEPAFKARFKLSATVDRNLMAVSNMPIQKTESVDSSHQKVTFAVTPAMSSYLLFFAVGDFERLSTHLGKTELGVVARRGSGEEARYALEQSKIVLNEYQHYFGIPFPLPKLDNVAAPGQSQFFGAMENWGAIFTFEYALLVDPVMSTSQDIRGIFSTEAHEIAHQWFGDLVTMNWWDDLWLNEGFASWMEERTTQKLHPEWHTDLNKVAVHETAMGLDAITGTHPIVQHITNVEQASSAFDSITYSKGASVIGMLEDYVGAEVWRKGVSQYLKDHANGNAVSDDLWKSVDKVSAKPITAIAHAFTLQAGVPLVVVESATCVNGQTHVKLSQREFTLDRPNKAPLTWPVPVTLKTQGNAAVKVLVQNGHAEVNAPGCGALIVNEGQNGYFRTLYPSSVLSDVSHQFAAIAAVDQLGLMSDRWALGSVGIAPLSDYLELVENLPSDANDKVISRVASSLNSLDSYYDPSKERDQLHQYAIKKLHARFQELGYEPKANESVTATELRAQLYSVLSKMGDAEVLKEARRRFEGSAANPSLLPAALRKTILQIVAEHADQQTWDQLHKMALSETEPTKKDFLYVLLGSARDEGLSMKALDLAISNEPSATVCASIIRAVSRNHSKMAFDFALAHRETVLGRVDNSARHRFIPGLITSANDVELADRLEKDSAEHNSQTQEVSTASASVRLRAKFKSTQLPGVNEWLSRYL